MGSEVLLNEKDQHNAHEILLQCTFNELDTHRYYLYSFDNKTPMDGTLWLYLNKEYGQINIKYYNFLNLEDSESKIIPDTLTDLTVPIKFNKPYFIFEVDCIYGGYNPIGFIKPSTDDNISESKTQLLFNTKSSNVGLINAVNKNLVIRIIQTTIALTESTNKEITINYNNDDLSFTNGVLIILSVSQGSLLVNNPSEAAILEFRIGYAEFIEVACNEGIEMFGKYIYYKLKSQRGVSYHFAFNKRINENYKIDYGYRTKGFIPKPAIKPEYIDHSINYNQNPLFSIREMPKDNFYYFAFEILEIEHPYTIEVKVNYLDNTDDNVIPLNQIIVSDKQKNPLSSHKNSLNKRLGVFISQSSVSNAALQLSYLTRDYSLIEIKTKQAVIEFPNKHLPYDIEYNIKTKTKESIENYCLSYNYITDSDDITNIKMQLEKKITFEYHPDTNELKWSSPDPFLSTFRIYITQKLDDDLENECLLFNKSAGEYKEVNNINNFSIIDLAPGEYSVNILAISSNSIFPYMIAYQRQKIKISLIPVSPIQEPETPQTIDFNLKSHYPFFINIKENEVNQEGVITLTFDKPITEQEENDLQFKIKIIRLAEDQDKGEHLPKDEDSSDFEYAQEERQFYRIYYRIKVDEIEQEKKILLNLLAISLIVQTYLIQT